MRLGPKFWEYVNLNEEAFDVEIEQTITIISGELCMRKKTKMRKVG